MNLRRALDQPPTLSMDDADPPTQPGTRAAPEPVRTWGEGWRSVVVAVAGMVAVVVPESLGRPLSPPALAALAVFVLCAIAGKDAKALAATIADIVRATRGG